MICRLFSFNSCKIHAHFLQMPGNLVQSKERAQIISKLHKNTAIRRVVGFQNSKSGIGCGIGQSVLDR